MSRIAMVQQSALRTALWLLLGGWVGAWACFGLVVAPAAFRILPTTELAGQLVGPVLAVLHVYGLAAGLALAPITWALGRGRLLVGAPVLLASVCAFSHFWISAELARLRPLAFGSGGSLENATLFGTLHRVSVFLYIAVSAATLLLVVLHAIADARESAEAAGDVP